MDGCGWVVFDRDRLMVTWLDGWMYGWGWSSECVGGRMDGKMEIDGWMMNGCMREWLAS